MMAVAASSAAMSVGEQGDVLSRMNDKGYHNWLLVGQSLLHMKLGLEGFADKVMTAFHTQLQQKHSPKTCTNATCISKNIVYDSKGQSHEYWKFKSPCPTQVCQNWLTDIAREMKNVRAKNQVYWTNTNVQLWPKERWEVAKAYMERGQQAIKTSSESDASSLLTLIGNCKFFLSCGLQPKDVKLVHDVSFP